MAYYKTSFNDPYISILGVSFHKDKIDFENFTTEITCNKGQTSITMAKLNVTINPIVTLRTALYPSDNVIEESSKLTKLIKDLYVHSKKNYIRCVCNQHTDDSDDNNTTDSNRRKINDTDEGNEHTEELVITEDSESDSDDSEDIIDQLDTESDDSSEEETVEDTEEENEENTDEETDEENTDEETEEKIEENPKDQKEEKIVEVNEK